MNSQNKIIYLDSFFFIHPATILLCGPTRSGKTTLLTKILHYSDKAFFAICMKLLWNFNLFTYKEFAIHLIYGEHNGPKVIIVISNYKL